MASPATPLELKTYDDLRAIPDDLNRYELISGEIIVSPSPRTKHQRVAFNLATAIRQFAEQRKAGEVFVAPIDVKFSRLNVVVPDVLFVGREQAAIIGADVIEGAPHLIAEVLSPSSRMTDLLKKAALYEERGVREYWIIDPEKESISVFVLQDGRYVPFTTLDGAARSLVLAGFEIQPGEVFATPSWMAGDVVDSRGEG